MLKYALLEQLCAIHAPSGNEGLLTRFLLQHIDKEKSKWSTQPEIYAGAGFQNNIILAFGSPRTAIFAHIDSIGFTVRYGKQLLSIGSPDAPPGSELVGEDSQGKIVCHVFYDPDNHAYYKYHREIERGTTLTYHPNFRDQRNYITTPYLDNRLGVFVALEIAKTLKDGIIVFSTWEEHGGGSVPYLIRFIYDRWKITQALVADITWVTEGVEAGKGVAISLRDRNLPRKEFVDRIKAIARKHQTDHQLEVEGVGSSDGRELQQSPYPVDWCFVGAPEFQPHSPDERVHKADIRSMIQFYTQLMTDL